MKKLLIFLCFIFILNESNAQWTNGQNASYVLGTSSFTGIGTLTPAGIAVDNTNNKLYVSDNCNHVVYRYSLPITSNDQAAELTFGTVSTSGTTQSLLNRPGGLTVDNTGRLYVLDAGNHRVVYFNTAYSINSNGSNASGVIGQSNYTSGSSNRGGSTANNGFNFYVGNTGLFGCVDGNTYAGYLVTSGSYLFVTDPGNNRILRFDTPTSSSTASVVFGQSNFTNNSSATTQSGLYNPFGITIYNDYLFVVDYNNYRVIRYDNATSTSTSGDNASAVIGQSNYTSSIGGLTSSKLDIPVGLAIDGVGRLYINDSNNGRTVTIDNVTSVDHASSITSYSNVLGESNFTTYANTYTQSKMYAGVTGIAVDSKNNKLYVGNSGVNRVLIFNASSALPIEIYNAYIQNNILSFNYQNANTINYFVLESSDNGIDFIPGEKISKTSSNKIHLDVAPGKYYRIVQYDIYNHIFYSTILYNTSNEIDYTYQNKIFVNLTYDPIEYLIYDFTGNLIETGNIINEKSFQEYSLCILKINTKNKVFTYKLLK